MMGYTDRHFRRFIRLISQRAMLYTEMVTTGQLLRGGRLEALDFSEEEHPLGLQLGGSVPAELAQCATIAAEKGYDEVNLNVGCPSGRVHAGHFGACLMKSPHLVADCVSAMRSAVTIPITVKTRIGVDEYDQYDYLCRFVEAVSAVGCQVFIIHARKAWLKGLSPKENREIPPLCYPTVYQLKRDFPHLEIIINGGIKTLADIDRHLPWVDGVMIGRAAYQHPLLLASVDRAYFREPTSVISAHTVLWRYLPYITQQMTRGVALPQLTRHLQHIFRGQPGARRWRRYLTEHAHSQSADVSSTFEQALRVAIGSQE